MLGRHKERGMLGRHKERGMLGRHKERGMLGGIRSGSTATAQINKAVFISRFSVALRVCPEQGYGHPRLKIMEKELSVGIGSIFKFDNQLNYQQWRFQAKGLIKYIDEANGSQASGSSASSLSAEALVLAEKEDAAAMFLITSALTFSQIVLIEICKTAREVIQKLDSIYAKKSDEKDSMSEHISKVQSIARQITESGDKMSEMLIMTKIIGTLPSRFKGFRQAWI
ncbi:hypothetical protein OBRU01_19408 [Operophtera brumata]|uniref:Uncharacterized protein n=1 Tax=Operophtera brumata TaxID=104452 RepID=A0A0L7KQZ9_OPEBR|nr:hypothetical protein OBRU01_19408 [Operophtera brumata]